MASQQSSRKSLIDSFINLARSYNFHGLDIDWSSPPRPFDSLLTEWRAAVEYDSHTSGKDPFPHRGCLYSSTYHSLQYPIMAISNSLDWVDVMAYDFKAPEWSPGLTGPPAALYNLMRQVSMDLDVTAWIQAGLAPNKIVLGLRPYQSFICWWEGLTWLRCICRLRRSILGSCKNK